MSLICVDWHATLQLIAVLGVFWLISKLVTFASAMLFIINATRDD